jgi:parvulin-like peptidyl-prolyl isomerase
MHDLQAPAVTLGDVSLTPTDFLRRLHRRGRLLPLLREAAVEQFLLDEAARLGLAVTAQELQAAADDFRRRRGLASADAAHAWLARERLSAHDLEAALERDLLLEKLKDHLTRDCLAEHFATHRDGYARARLRQIVVEREDLARELLHQIHDDGADFAELARAHSRHPHGAESGSPAQVLRRELSAAVARAVFSARAGDVVGPLATPQGFLLLLVQEQRPGELDDATAALIRQELFDAWLNDKLKGVPFTVPLLDAL